MAMIDDLISRVGSLNDLKLQAYRMQTGCSMAARQQSGG